jgi:glycosyltransferase involved in cell wall biosynthesis
MTYTEVRIERSQGVRGLAKKSMSRPAVSVIIPTHDRAAFLIEALDSVASQTFKDYEVIVVDDGSAEDIAVAVRDHATQPRVMRQPHQGPAAARNYGLSEASSDIVAFLDSDDLWLPRKLDVFMQAMAARADVNIFYGPMAPIDESRRPVAGRTKACHDGWITPALFCSSFVHVPTIVCRKQVLLDAGGFDASLPVCEDYDLWLRLSLKQQFALIDEPLALRRLHEGRLSKSCMSRNLAVKADMLEAFYEANNHNGHLDPAIAQARLAKVFFAAARASLRDRRYRQALRLSRSSRHYGKSPISTIPLAASAKTLSLLGGDRCDAAPPTTG